MKSSLYIFVLLLLLAGATSHAQNQDFPEAEITKKRIADDIANGNPIFVRVLVPLCDNKHQGIVPVSAELGDGQNPRTNLYWGARYGVKTFLTRDADWDRLGLNRTPNDTVLETLTLHKRITHKEGKDADVYIVAEAIDGRYMKYALNRLLNLAAARTHDTVTITLKDSAQLTLTDPPHLIIFAGHNGLMDNHLNSLPKANPDTPPRAVAVLACASAAYFHTPLQEAGALPLVLTSNLMAPEAYLIDPLITEWVKGSMVGKVRSSVAAAYSEYQKCSLQSARQLFQVGQ